MPTPEQDLDDKLRLEAQFRPVMDAYNGIVVRDFTRRYGQDGAVPDLSVKDDALAAILLAQYEKTAGVFAGGIQKDLPEDVAMTASEATTIAAALSAFYAQEAPKHAAEINNTTQQDAQAAAIFSQEERVANPAISALEGAAIAGAVLHRKLKGRLITTVMTETQMAAESAKATEAEVLSGVPPSVTGGTPQRPEVDKEWVTVGDSRVRDTHLAADGQTRKVNAPFDVGGEQLRWPGDSSLGASLGNIINCRCSAGYDEQGIIETRRAQERNA